MSDAINELQKEWRAIVLEKLSTLEEGLSAMRVDIVDIKTSFVKQQALKELQETYQQELAVLRSKIDELNAFKYKLIGITLGVNVVIAVILQVAALKGLK